MQKLRHCILKNFGRGVNLDQTSVVDLGGNGQNKGNNQIYSSYAASVPPGPAISFVGAHSRAVGIPDISAKYNYWGNAYPPTSMIASWVNYSNWLTVPPASAAPGEVSLEITALETILRSEPNPFNRSLNLRLDGLPIPETLVLTIFDIQGRQLKQWRETVTSTAVHVTWDGRGDDGHPVPAGLYFIKASAAGKAFTAKVVRLVQ